MATSREARYKRAAQEARKRLRKSQAENKAHQDKVAELQKKLDDSAPALKEHAERSHRQLFDKAATRAGVDPDMLGDFWRLADVDTEGEPDPKAIARAVKSTLKGRDYFLRDEDDDEDDDEDLEDDRDDEDLEDDDEDDDEDLDDFDDDEDDHVETIFDLGKPQGRDSRNGKRTEDRRDDRGKKKVPEPERGRGGRESRDGRDRDRGREKPRDKGDRADGRGKSDGNRKPLGKGNDGRGDRGKLSRGEGAGRGGRDEHKRETTKDVVDREFEATGRKNPYSI